MKTKRPLTPDARSAAQVEDKENQEPLPPSLRSGRPAAAKAASQPRKASRSKLSPQDSQQTFLAWEKYANVPSIREGARMLGIARNTYRSFRNGEMDQSLTIRLAMAALAGNLKPWGL